MNHEPKQLELPIVNAPAPAPRPRVRLDDDMEDAPYYSKWEVQEPPPCDGYWDVTDNRTGTMNERWWFSKSRGPMSWKDPVTMRTLMHDEFLDRSLSWRGLVRPSLHIYPSPPYNTEALMVRAKELNVTMRTMYAAYTRPQRKRNRL